MKSTNLIKIIAEELNMPHDASLSEILAALSVIDTDGEIKKLLVQTATQDLLERFKAEGIA